jgi:hypothetical protein
VGASWYVECSSKYSSEVRDEKYNGRFSWRINFNYIDNGHLYVFLRSDFMKNIYKNALLHVQRRIDVTASMAAKENNMKDCGWTDRQHKAYALSEHFKAVYKFEKIQTRMNRKAV